MATYTPGANEDEVIKTTETDRTLDLTKLTTEFQRLKAELQSLPEVKTVPDQDTLAFWNERAVPESEQEKHNIDQQAIALYDEADAVRGAGLLPAKYEDEYQQLKTYVENL